MLFNSPVYIFLFLPIVAIVFFSLNSRRLILAGKVWLVLSSLFFYGYWNPKYLFLIISSILVNFALSKILNTARQESKSDSHLKLIGKSILAIGITFNLGLLGYFKYSDFFIQNLNFAFGTEIPLLKIALPLAISFFTFQQIAYLISRYHNDSQNHEFLNYCLFVTFFPQLIAGPIVRHREMMPQFKNIRNKLIDWRNISSGIFIFTLGLFKKVVIADSLAVWASRGFDTDKILSFFEAWETSLSYTFQLYYDFSGYTDMAIGAALLFNIRLPINFNSPYKALSIQDFWRRWHITLSNWLRDYLYIPLGGNRSGSIRTYLNLLITFLLGGLWHGAGWTFVIWGAAHGIALCIHRLWQQMRFKMPALLGWFSTFIFVNFTWVFFRADTFNGAIRILKSMIGFNGFKITIQFNSLLNLLTASPFFSLRGTKDIFLFPIDTAIEITIFALIAFLLPNTIQLIRFIPYKRNFYFKPSIPFALATGIISGISLIFLLITKGSVFLYFNF
jgi:alginate O-acetyltransferase complex protein AlgI